ncbi:transporter substrate-binding protein [Roseospira navarrensis]|uniref:Transporter substrate-binding protein n=1 Tax=Roseospira navarrensis TaxID=140058 RepID=A0A7X1ZD38_9PROT|nr:transporter substrate-binding protein [Roseospira navarrensis]MQX36335.1 transporter substrate-binding protein [Roseospira navarrensis]
MTRDSTDHPVGLLYSTTGSYAAIGRDALDGALMAVDEVNADPAFPFTLAPVTANPGGVTETYHRDCAAMLREHGCRHVIGTITSLSRKEVLPIIEKHDALLWYMCPYEGFECSENIIYLGADPSQHIVPLFAHVLTRYGTRGYLTGSNYIWGWETNRIARELIAASGGEVVAERYLPMGSEDVARLVAEIREKRPDFVLNTLIGPSSYAFFRAYAALAAADESFRPEVRPVVSCNLTECELGLVGDAGIGHLSTAIWFDDGATPTARAFGGRARERFGADRRCSANMVNAHAAVWLLAHAIRATGTAAPAAVRDWIVCHGVETALGETRVDAATQHTPQVPCLARIADGGRFEVLARAAGPVSPDPYLSRLDAAALTRADGRGLPSALRPFGGGARPALRVVTP